VTTDSSELCLPLTWHVIPPVALRNLLLKLKLKFDLLRVARSSSAFD